MVNEIKSIGGLFLMLRKYECMYITDVQLDEEEYKKLGELMATIIANNGGEIVDKMTIGARNFCYPIKKKTSGIYSLIVFNANNKVLSALRERLNYDMRLLRYMIIKVQH
ncbi:MAG TPA: 30S ribosomal protein S6 [bacterium]|nr:30S ribosomal protein S6 [bacterium]HPP88370.1 30S ribosomal protein S6 [bacterium]